MTEKPLFCVISQQPCGSDGQGDGEGSCGACVLSDKFLRDIFEMLEPRGAEDFWTRDEGDMLIAGFTKGNEKRKTVMRIQRGDTVG